VFWHFFTLQENLAKITYHMLHQWDLFVCKKALFMEDSWCGFYMLCAVPDDKPASLDMHCVFYCFIPPPFAVTIHCNFVTVL